MRPATRIWREGQRFESAVAVDPPTRPVPPSTSTREFNGLPPFLAGEVAVATAAAGKGLGKFGRETRAIRKGGTFIRSGFRPGQRELGTFLMITSRLWTSILKGLRCKTWLLGPATGSKKRRLIKIKKNKEHNSSRTFLIIFLIIIK